MTTSSAATANSPQGRPVLTVHIGFPKTGTSTLQHHLFRKHRQIEYLGKWGFPGGEKQAYRDIHVSRIVNHLVGQRSTAPDFELCHRIARERIWPGGEGGKILVLSKEGLANGHRDEMIRWANNLKTVFGQCRVLVMLRDPIRKLPSQYSQFLKQNNLSPRARWKKPHFLAFTEWVQRFRNREDLYRHLNQIDTLEVYSAAFGRESIRAFLFEEYQTNPADYIRGVCEFLGVDPAEGQALAAHRRENRGLGQSNVERLERITGSRWRSWWFQMSPLWVRSRMIGVYATSRGGDALQTEIPDDIREIIRETLRSECDRLRKEWKLPVDRYGYLGIRP